MHCCPTCGQPLPDDDTLRVDPAGIVVRGGRFANVGATLQLRLLELVHGAGGRFVSRADIESSLWPMDVDVPAGEVIQCYVSKLNAKLRPLGVSIDSAPRGVGAYRLVIHALEAAAAPEGLRA